jgi:hypothetical protein
MPDLAQILQRRTRADYRSVFSGPAGARVLADLLGFCGIGSACGAVDLGALAKHEGRRRVGLRIASFLNLSEEDMAKRAMTANFDDDK